MAVSYTHLDVYKRQVANYSSLYRFQLPNGSYNIISTTQSDSIPSPKNLNDIVIHQGPICSGTS